MPLPFLFFVHTDKTATIVSISTESYNLNMFSCTFLYRPVFHSAVSFVLSAINPDYLFQMVIKDFSIFISGDQGFTKLISSVIYSIYKFIEIFIAQQSYFQGAAPLRLIRNIKCQCLWKTSIISRLHFIDYIKHYTNI